MADAQTAKPKVALELVLGVDVSGSIDSTEYNMQKTGYVNAFQDATIINKINKAAGGIAVTYVEWAGASEQKQVVPWTLITDATSSNAFANLIKNSSRAYSGSTGVGNALAYATNLFATNSYDSDRQVIDMSGDGKNNEGAAPNKAAALAAGVDTINALCIDAPTGETGTFDWYKANVIGGKDPFAFMVKDFSDFSRAVSAKISQEILAEYAKFDYTYYYGGKQAGEYYKGYVYAPSDYYKVGYKQNVAKDENNDPGYYQITAESAANAAYKSLVGQVYVSEYYDLESKNKFTGTGLVNNSKAVGTGYLGTEVSYIVNNTNSLYRFGNYSNVFYEADIPLDAGRFGFRFDYGNGDYYTGYFYAKYTDYNVGWNKETSAGEYSIIAKTYANVSKSVYGQVYLDKYYDTLSKKTFQSNQLISMFGSYYGNAFLGSESGWLIKAYTYPKYRFFGFGYFEAEGI